MELISRLQHRSRRRKAAHGGGHDHGAAESAAGHSAPLRQSAIRQVLADADTDSLTPALGVAARRGTVPATHHSMHVQPVGLSAQTTELRTSSFREELLENVAVPVSHRQGGEKVRRRRGEKAPRRGPPPAPRPAAPAAAERHRHANGDGRAVSGNVPPPSVPYADALEQVGVSASSEDEEGSSLHIGSSDRRRPSRACRVHASPRGGVRGLEACRPQHRRTAARIGLMAVVAAVAGRG